MSGCTHSHILTETRVPLAMFMEVTRTQVYLGANTYTHNHRYTRDIQPILSHFVTNVLN